jgi:hypothetical protein
MLMAGSLGMAGADYQARETTMCLNAEGRRHSIARMTKKRHSTDEISGESVIDWDGPFDLRFGRRPDQVVTIQPVPPDTLPARRRKEIRRAVIETVRADRAAPVQRVAGRAEPSIDR